MNPWLSLTVAIASEVIGTSALQASEGFSRPRPSAIVIAGFAVAFYFIAATLKHMPVGVAYAIWSGVGIVLISLIGWRWFDQPLDAPALAGMGLIIAGVVVINLLSRSITH